MKKELKRGRINEGQNFIDIFAKNRFNALLKKSGWYQVNAQIKLLCMHQVIEGVRVGPKNYTFRAGEGVWPINSDRIRQILPETINFSFSSNFFQPK